MEQTISRVKQAVYAAPDWQSPIPGYQLGMFRIVFGILMIWEMLYFIRIDFVDAFLDLPMIQLTYPGFSWLSPMPEKAMEGLIYVLLGAAILITLGKWFRWAMVVFFLGFTYIFLLDQAYYNNHLYLLSLISFWMIFLPMDATLSATKAPSRAVSAGSLAVLRFHIVLVYLFGGISKINPDWLFRQEPVRTLVHSTPILEDTLGEEFAVYLLIYGGIVFDLLVGFLLLYKPTRSIGLLAAVTFNVMNATIFNDINIFPFFMLGSLALFFDPHTVQTWFVRTSSRQKNGKKNSAKGKPKRAKKTKEQPATGIQPIWADGIYLRGFFVAYMLFHCIWPFRHVVIPGHVDWTGQGQRFAWRMKIQTRSTEELEFAVMDYRTKTIIPTDLDAYKINVDQKRNIALMPGLLMQTVDFLEERAKQKLGHDEVGVRARVKVSLNGRPPQYVVDPEKDLTKETYRPWRKNDWILPLDEG